MPNPQLRHYFDNRLCWKTLSGFERPFFHLAASGCIDDRTNIACFAVFARRKNRSLSGRRRGFQTEPMQFFRWPLEEHVNGVGRHDWSVLMKDNRSEP